MNRVRGLIRNLVFLLRRILPQAKKPFVYVDMFSQSQVFKNYPEIFSSDGFHPSDAGYHLGKHNYYTSETQALKIGLYPQFMS